MQEFKKLVNFRDLGGIQTGDGRKVKPCRILRGAQLHDLPEEDKRILLEKYSLKHIIDLRDVHETQQAPDDVIEGVVYHNFEVMKTANGNAASEDEMRPLDPDYALQVMKGLYNVFITNSHARECWRKTIDIFLSMEEGSAIFHCHAGKDRTGMVAAILLTIFGVPRETIMEDYMLSKTMREEENKRIYEEEKAKGADEAHLKGLMTVYSVEEDFLESAYAAAEREYGSFENFIKEGIGVSDREAEKLREMYLE